MLLSGALCALFMTGCWLYCLTDAILTPAADCRGLPKRAWIAVIAVTFIAGALAWLIARRPPGDSPAWTGRDDAALRHPAGRETTAGPRAGVKGPDDDPEFLSALDQAIRRNPPVS